MLKPCLISLHFFMVEINLKVIQYFTYKTMSFLFDWIIKLTIVLKDFDLVDVEIKQCHRFLVLTTLQ